jgi:pimeloyl-ACP methyl ester carboxylesterase
MAVFPKEIPIPPRSLAERGLPTSCAGLSVPRGGHFAAMEQPGLLAQDIREFFRPLR